MAPLQDVIRSRSLDWMFYVDNTQIYIVIDDPKHSVDSVDVLRACINDVFTWNTKNMLKCNPGKTTKGYTFHAAIQQATYSLQNIIVS